MDDVEDLIPGLPADVARECLAHVPYTHFRTLRLTSPLWRQELHSASFHSLRKSRRLTRHVITLVHSMAATAASSIIYSLAIFDPSGATWHPLPPLGLPLYCRVAQVERGLVLIGGWDPQTWAPADEVFVFDFPSATWRCGARMPGPKRSFFGCASLGSLVVVAGGHDERKDALKSAMAYDANSDVWAPLPDMGRERDECAVAVTRGRLHVIGGYGTEAQGRFTKSAEVFDFQTWEWGLVDEEFLETATCPRTCAAGPGGEMYVCEGGHVLVQEEGRWKKVVALPAELRTALQVMAWEKRVMVMGSAMQGGTQVCYILERKGGEEEMMTWRKVEVSPEYAGNIQAACCLEI